MKQWKIFSRKIVFKSELFNVVETHLELPGKKEKIYHTAERRTSVLVFPITENYEIYLIRQYRYMLEKEMIEAVAGFIDEGEEALEAAKRELKEEAGVEASDWLSLGKIVLAASVFKSQAEMFLAQDLELGAQDLDDAEDIEVVKMPFSEALEKVVSGEINESGTMLGVLLIDNLKREKKI